MEKVFYKISEVAQILGESTSLVRFWSNNFPKFVKPVRTAKGDRQYRNEDVEMLKKIHFLVNERGMTLEGVERQLTIDASPVDKTVKALDTLKAIRAQLVEIRKTL